MIENIHLAFQGIWSHKLRSLLTMLGIIIGIAAIMTIVSTIKGTNEQIKQNLIGAGDNAVKIGLYQNDRELNFEYEEVPDGVPPITQKDKEEILKNEEIDEVSSFNIRSYMNNVYYKNNSFMGSVLGIDENYFDIYKYFISNGRNFIEDDYKKFNKVAIIDAYVAEAFFENENPIGKIIEIGKEPFTIIGIAKQDSSFSPVINSFQDYTTYVGEATGKIFVTNSVWPIICKFDEPENLVIKANSTDNMTKAGRLATDYLNSRLTVAEDSNVSYKNDDLLKQAKQLQDLSSSSNRLLVLIASISLIVGGIGVMNIMLVSVSERTREIGLKKAIGARRKRILMQFLTEAVVLTSIGGIIGVVSGIIMSQIFSKISSTPVAISPIATAISVGFSMLIGIIFGLVPAIKASKLNPIEALRSE